MHVVVKAVRLCLAVGISVSGLAVGLCAQARLAVHDVETRLAWHRQHLEMRESSPFKDKIWTFIGPEIMSGRITDIAVPAGTEHSFYVATASGGVWQTEDDGKTWEPIFDDAPSASVGAIAVAQSDANRLYVGLGESNIFRSSMAGTGVYRSDDAGRSWQHLGLGETQHIGRIVIDPNDADRVFVAACGNEYSESQERGVYASEDGGKNWRRLLFVNERTGAIDLVMDPSDSQVLYAAMWDRIRRPWDDPKPGPGSGIYRSEDGGKSWKELRRGLPKKNKTGRIGLAISKAKPSVVYAIIDNHEFARKARADERDSYGRPKKDVIKGAEVYRSNNRGKSWKKVSRSNPVMEGLFSTYGWVFGQIRVDPNDVDTVYALGVSLLKSTDGGVSFRRVRSRGLHLDHHALWIDPEDSDRLISGNDGGINLSYDGGRSWKNIENHGVVQFYNVGYDMAEPFNVYGSIQDNGSWMGPVSHRPGKDPGNQWKRIPGGEASIIEVDPSDPNVLYSESFYGRIQRSTLTPRKTTPLLPAAKDVGMQRLRGQWLAPFIISPHDPSVIYHGMQVVLRSKDKGDSWERISDDLSYNDSKKQGNISFQTITSLSESPLSAGLLYAGTDDGRVHVTKDGGKKWARIMKGLPKRKWVSRLVASAFAEGTVYLSQNGKREDEFQAWLFKSVDYGKTWVDISKGIPGGPVNVIREDPSDSKTLYVGTDLGVYVTVDGAKSWHVLGSKLPITFVHDLIVHPRDRVMVIATHGRGMWSLDVSEL